MLILYYIIEYYIIEYFIYVILNKDSRFHNSLCLHSRYSRYSLCNFTITFTITFTICLLEALSFAHSRTQTQPYPNSLSLAIRLGQLKQIFPGLSFVITISRDTQQATLGSQEKVLTVGFLILQYIA